MIVIIIVLAFLLIGITARHIYLKREIRSVAEKVQKTYRNDSNEQIFTQSQDSDILALANAINLLFTENYHRRAKFEKYQRQFKRNMENISHDLRTPLTSIYGYLSRLLNSQTLTSNDQHYVEIAKTKADTLTRLVNSLFDLTRLEAKEYPLHMTEVNVNLVLIEELVSYYDYFSKLNPQPRVSIDDKNVLKILADKSALIRVFNNLLDNIVLHDGHEVSICCCKDGPLAVVTIANKAQDIRQDDVIHLFDRFYTVDKTRASQSNGLGLSIAKELVEQMNGEISVSYDNQVLSFVLRWRLFEGQ